MSRLQGLVSYPVPILWIVFYNTSGMRYEVSSTRQCYILIALYETIRHQSRCHCQCTLGMLVALLPLGLTQVIIYSDQRLHQQRTWAHNLSDYKSRLVMVE